MLPLAFEARVTLFARRPLPALQALDRPGIAVCDILSDAAALPGLVASLQPHVLVLQDAVEALDSLLLDVLNASPARPPRVIACFDAPGMADALCPADLPGAVSDVMLLPAGMLAAPSLPRREECAGQLLASLGMAAHLGGFACLARGAALLSAMPAPAPPLQYALYPHIANALALRPAAVERRIRSAVESAWLRGSLQAQSALLGLSVSAERGKPTNGELLFRLADRIDEILYSA